MTASMPMRVLVTVNLICVTDPNEGAEVGCDEGIVEGSDVG